MPEMPCPLMYWIVLVAMPSLMGYSFTTRTTEGFGLPLLVTWDEDVKPLTVASPRVSSEKAGDARQPWSVDKGREGRD